jgi:hypothetical protein
MNLEDLNKEIEKFQKLANIEYLPLYAQGKLDAYLELLPLVKKLTIPVVMQSLPKRLSNTAYLNAREMMYEDFVTWWDEQV